MKKETKQKQIEIEVGDIFKIHDFEYWKIHNIKEYQDMYTPQITLYGFDVFWIENSLNLSTPTHKKLMKNINLPMKYSQIKRKFMKI